MAAKFGLQTDEVKFDKCTRKLIRISDGTVLATQSIVTWRATPDLRGLGTLQTVSGVADLVHASGSCLCDTVIFTNG